jgi:hypothetical protein
LINNGDTSDVDWSIMKGGGGGGGGVRWGETEEAKKEKGRKQEMVAKKWLGPVLRVIAAVEEGRKEGRKDGRKGGTNERKREIGGDGRDEERERTEALDGGKK